MVNKGHSMKIYNFGAAFFTLTGAYSTFLFLGLTTLHEKPCQSLLSGDWCNHQIYYWILNALLPYGFVWGIFSSFNSRRVLCIKKFLGTMGVIITGACTIWKMFEVPCDVIFFIFSYIYNHEVVCSDYQFIYWILNTLLCIILFVRVVLLWICALVHEGEQESTAKRLPV